LGVAYEVLSKRGAYFRFGELMLGQGRENAKVFLEENPAILLEIEQIVRQEAGLPALETAEE